MLFIMDCLSLSSFANNFMQYLQSITIALLQVLKQEKVDYIVAPYEADAQMAFLSMNKLVDAVITEDSDLIPFGCSTVSICVVC